MPKRGNASKKGAQSEAKRAADYLIWMARSSGEEEEGKQPKKSAAASKPKAKQTVAEKGEGDSDDDDDDDDDEEEVVVRGIKRGPKPKAPPNVSSTELNICFGIGLQRRESQIVSEWSQCGTWFKQLVQFFLVTNQYLHML
jgi:hypothetical protein